MHIAGGEQRQAVTAGQALHQVKAFVVLRMQVPLPGQPQARSETLAQGFDLVGEDGFGHALRRPARNPQRQQLAAALRQVLQCEPVLALAAAAPGMGDE